MFKSQQYRAKATESGELVKSSTGAEESRKFQDLEDRFVSLADNADSWALRTLVLRVCGQRSNDCGQLKIDAPA